MALREYAWKGHTYRFEESEAPEGAIPLTARKAAKAPSDKAAKAPANKARTPRAKR